MAKVYTCQLHHLSSTLASVWQEVTIYTLRAICKHTHSANLLQPYRIGIAFSTNYLAKSSLDVELQWEGLSNRQGTWQNSLYPEIVRRIIWILWHTCGVSVERSIRNSTLRPIGIRIGWSVQRLCMSISMYRAYGKLEWNWWVTLQSFFI